MIQDNNTGRNGYEGESEQIDLVDLLMQLWRGKLTIIVCVIVTVALAVAYVFLAKEKWTSTATITRPDAAQIANYHNALNTLDSSVTLPDVQNQVINRFNSAFIALAESLDNQEEPEILTIEPSVKGQSLPLTISYVSDSAEAAQRGVAEYIQKIDEQIAEELELDLNNTIKVRVTNIKDSLSNQEAVSQEQKDLRIKQISESLKYAQKSNVTKPQIQQTQDVTQETMFLLGTEALSSMIANEASRPLTFPAAYYGLKKNLLDIEKLKVDPKTIHVYRYVMKPTLPIRRDSPKRGLTLVLAVLLGGMIGAGVVLGRNALRNYKPKA
ncbi:LPS O-antigen chain length determinant protein WzzB [Pseudocitrobacter sp. RIT415]|uniref:LPS O-antigen chain length determinant protein WzzB n=1 Tax=Pseudocitrobacter TaxID=1504576 RepID=UPI000D3C50B2|nr:MULTISPECIES: LPS O-antigen chain length determinant protein WzzB [Pseudocitrobacter]RAU46801.1 LPS O-antigen chain length determinant protein WzzB [Pseudocitrobacter sp. RIT 415]GHD90204.1 LPS O-antigen chain length determinant protein WzzB [Pseudocitrobacter faecalis]